MLEDRTTVDPRNDKRPLGERMAAYGCTRVVPLGGELVEPTQLEYLDLLARRASAQSRSVHAVVEHQGTALLYVVNAAEEAVTDAHRTEVQKMLANRSDPAWLGILRAGSLEVWPIGFAPAASEPIKVVVEDTSEAPLFFQSLVHGTFQEKPEGTDYVYNRIFGLLDQTIQTFVAGPRNDSTKERKRSRPKKQSQAAGSVDPLDVLSMAGRALFFRFLIDRRIVLPSELLDICPAADDLKDGFSNAQKAAQTSAWLDETFNGDFLPLIDEKVSPDQRAERERAYLQFYQGISTRTGGEMFRHLHAILRSFQHVGAQSFQLTFDWGDFDFAHIPIGVLSQVYESFAHRVDPRTARDTSVHYTPRTIARLLVEEAFAAIAEPADAHVLDPACGAGIFLGLAFRRLVQERWRKTKQQPSAIEIRKILYEQVRGFDISESALRLAALTLYITAIELNASPCPPKTLKFPRNLRSEVLFHFGHDKAAPAPNTFPLGSLGNAVPTRFNEQFDVVLGNPPWTQLKEDKAKHDGAKAAKTTDKLNQAFTEIGRRALTTRGLHGQATQYKNPSKGPDLPFVFRATEWAKEKSGLIAMVLPARVFLRSPDKHCDAWRDLVSTVSVTGIINGADLRKTAVWRNVDMPFCLFFARNEKPRAGHRFHYATPSYELDVNGTGRFRIDYATTQPVQMERVLEKRWLLKTLMFGTWRDVELMERIFSAFPCTLEKIWKQWDPDHNKTGQGYKLSPNLEQDDASFLLELKDFGARISEFSIPVDQLCTFYEKHRRKTAHRSRRETLYQPPLTIIPESPGEDPRHPHAYHSAIPLAFSQSFFGYSCAGHPEAETLSALLYLLPHSEVFRYFCLMTSIRVGFDRQTFNKEDLDRIPFPRVEGLAENDKGCVRELARALEHERDKPWEAIDQLFLDLYKLTKDDGETIRDTLFSSSFYREAGRDAFAPPQRETRNLFRQTMRDMLDPFFSILDECIAVEEAPFAIDPCRSAWQFSWIAREGVACPLSSSLLHSAMKEADQRAASRIIVRAPASRGLLLGILNQSRYWTRTRARICAQAIVRDYLDAFDLPEET